MATPSDRTLEGVAEGGTLGSSSLKDFQKPLAKFILDDLESKNYAESLLETGPEQESATIHKRGKTPKLHVAKPSSNGIREKRKAILEELATIPKRRKSNESEIAAVSIASSPAKVLKSPIVLSRLMQNKLDHSKRQQAFYRSGVKARSERNLRNAVLDKIAELEEVARKKKVKEVEKMNKVGKRQDNPLPSKSMEGQEKENETVEIDQRRDMQQISAVDLVQEQITETENMEAIAGGDKEQDPSQAEASKKGQKKLNPTYAYRLGELSTKLPTQDQVAALGHSMSMGPKHLGRTASTVHGHRHAKQWMTNGSTSQDLLLPSADTKKGFESHTRLTDLSQGQIIYMCGLHLTWLNPKHDEFLSYSKELLFLLVHALGRHHTGQRNVTIQYINRGEATTLEGEPAAFYDALDIYNIFGVPSRPGWSNYLDLALNPRKFTHKFLSHGIVRHNDATLKQARLEDLIKDGLFVFFPELEAPENHERCGLYTEQVALELGIHHARPQLARRTPLSIPTTNVLEPLL